MHGFHNFSSNHVQLKKGIQFLPFLVLHIHNKYQTGPSMFSQNIVDQNNGTVLFANNGHWSKKLKTLHFFDSLDKFAFFCIKNMSICQKSNLFVDIF